MTIAGFTSVRELHRGRSRVVYRARRMTDGAPVILKMPGEEVTAGGVAALIREYEILHELDTQGVVRALELIALGDRHALVLEDTGGEPLAALLRRGRLELRSFLRLALHLARTLGELHKHRIIHKDINPKNILVDAAAGSTTLIDFSIATRLPFEEQRVAHPNVLEGTIAYISPEQTGRMNRDVDHRSDFYSLGVTFYEMLTGRVPFEASDPLELVHAHIARTPVAPRALDAAIPGPVSDIVMMLLAKTAEARYQSAHGLAADLEQCIAELDRSGRIEHVRAGENDITDRFSIPQKLYGREAERAALLAALDRSAAGTAELLLVSGYAGIGKTSLIREILHSLTGRRGYFITGKFDQLVRNVPYAAVTQAFGGLARQLLTEDDETVSRWKAALLSSVGSNCAVLLEVIPALERIVGPQPPAPELGSTEAQNRFNRVFLQFLDVFASPDHPLVLFLDDLQWADSASLALLRTMLGGSDLRGLLVIGAYRDNEVGEGHALADTLADIRRTGAPVTEIMLGPLALDHLAALVTDTLRCPASEARPLAELVRRKTDGNPFFVTQFLTSVHQEGLVTLDHSARRWRADVAAIERMDLTDNVVDLMARRMGRLPEGTRDTLKLAACIGNEFDVATLALVGEAPLASVAANLWQAIEPGLVVATGETYGIAPDDPRAEVRWAGVQCRFLHDRVQQAAYALIPADVKREIHLRVGRLMLAGRSEAEIDEHLFAIVDQLDLGLELITAPAEKMRLAELNHAAGRKAKASTAYDTARRYFEVAVSLLPTDRWASAYGLAFPLHLDLAECTYLCGDFTAADSLFELLVRKARTREDRAEVYLQRVRDNENQARYAEAVAAAKEGLEPFGIALPDTRTEQDAALAREIAEIRRLIGDRAISSLLQLPVCTRQDVRICMRLLITAWSSAYIANEAGLNALISALIVRLSLEHGNTEESACGYAVHGITVGTRLGDYRSGYELGRLAIEVNERFDDRKSRAKVQELFSCFINPWRQPIRTGLPHAREAYRAGLETGDFAYATYGIFVASWYALLGSDDLAGFYEEYQLAERFLEQIHNHSFAAVQRVILQWAQALRGLTEPRGTLNGEKFAEDAFARAWAGHPFFATFFEVARLAVCYTFGRYDEAAEAARRADRVVATLDGTIWPTLLAFYGGLNAAAQYPSLEGDARAAALERMREGERRLARWAEDSAEWFAPQQLLLAAEIERVTGAQAAAIDRYEAALRAAAALGEPRLHALANERYAQLWLEREQPRVAFVFLHAARRIYAKWGAAAVAEELSRRLPHVLADDVGDALQEHETSAERRTPGAFTTTVTGAGVLDAFSVLKAAQAITGEIELESLLRTLMQILVENAGAERGALVLRAGDELLVQAAGGVATPARVLQASPLTGSGVAPAGLVQYVVRSGESVLLEDARSSEWAADLTFAQAQPRSVLCTPILHQGRATGAVYLENNLAPGAFTTDRLQVVQVLSAQAAIAIRNAELFAEVATLRDRLEAENVYLLEEINTQSGFEEIIGRSPALQRVLAQVERVAPSDATVLISGETGTGKELIARALHNLSPRRGRTLVAVNCGAIAANLIESELFGHEKGAFTGAHARKLGRFELADGGTLFLDEIGDLPIDMQVKLLRVLQDGEFERVGGTRIIKVDVRVIAATNRDLARAVEEGRFRPDLFYRLNVFPIHMPPLRERREDIAPLVRYFVMKFGAKLGKHIEVIRKVTLDTLTDYTWPGNIRELRNVVERSVIVTRGDTLELADWLAAAPAPGHDSDGGRRTLEDVERAHIISVLENSGWRVSGPRGAARVLGLKPTTLEARMKKLGIQRPSPTGP